MTILSEEDRRALTQQPQIPSVSPGTLASPRTVMPSVPSVASTVQPQIPAISPGMGASPRTPDSALVVPSVASTVQPQIPGFSPGAAVSPRTPDAVIAAGAPPPAVAPPVYGNYGQTAPPSVSGQFTPRTPDGPVATYQAQLQGNPAPVAGATGAPVSPALGAMARAALDPLAAARADAGNAYDTGAQTSVPTGVGMGARQLITSAASRAGGAVLDASGAVRDAAANVARPLYEGVRAFITGRPPAPDAPAGAVPSVAAAARGPVTIDGRTGQPITTANTMPGTWHPAGADADIAAMGNEIQPVAAGVPGGVPSVRGIQPPAQVTSVQTSNTPANINPTTPLGGLFRSIAGMQLMRRANNDQQRTFKNQVTAQGADIAAAKVGGELKRSAAEVDKTQAETTKLKQDNENAVQVQNLRKQLVDETDPKKRKALENKLYALQGKKQGNFQVTQVESVDPATGMVTKTPYIIDADTGNARPVTGTGGGPPGMTYLGKSPQGKRVFQDAQGNKHVED